MFCKMRYYLWLLLLLLISCEKEQTETNNIESFARLYGYVRWFHPSDEALEIDWNKFAVLGVQKVKNIQSADALKDTLFRLFSPIVPGLQINKNGKFNNSACQTPVTGGKVVAWQHNGVGLGIVKHTYIYRSIRSYIDIVSDTEIGKTYGINITDLVGKKLKFSGYLKKKAAKEGHQAALYIYPILRNNIGSPVVSHKIDITSEEWEKYELTMTVPEQSLVIRYGVMLSGSVEAWADDFQLLMEENGIWKTIDHENMGFENGTINKYYGDWSSGAGPYNVEITDSGSYSGRYCMKAGYKGTLFDKMPCAGEAIREPIGRKLYCHIPLTLYTTDGKSTYPKTGAGDLSRLKDELDRIKINRKNFDSDVNLASIIVAWNVFQHFFPYMHVIGIDWDKELGQTIQSTLENTDNNEFEQTIMKLVAKLQDGHAGVSGKWKYYLPASFDYIEDSIVVTSSKDSVLQKGDIIKKIDGKDAFEVLAEQEQTISGSRQL